MTLINELSPLYKQPDDIQIQLKPHQLAMLHKSLEIEKKHTLCVMKDKPGSGKTYVVLSMLNELKKYNIKNKEKAKVNVIIVPHNIYFQWMYSIERLTYNLSYIKFVEYEHLLNLYNHPEDLYEKDIILVSSSYYNVLSSTMTSLNLNVDRLIIDEIDNVGNLINQSFNTEFTLFISASFDIHNNNGYFSKTLLENDLNEMIIQCENEFIDNHLDLEDPIHEHFLCSNIYVDKVLDGLLDKDEIKNINACYFKVNDKNYDQKIASNEINLISLILRENNNLIENYDNQLIDINKNIDFYVNKKQKKDEFINEFNKNMNGITKVFELKNMIVDVIEHYLNYFDFYINPKVDFEYIDMYDILVEKRRTNIKEFRIYLNNLMESIYHFYSLKINNQENGINEENIFALHKVYQLLNHLIKERNTEVNKLFDDFDNFKKDNKLGKECLNLLNQMQDFDSYIISFTETLENIKIVLKCDQLIENLEENKKDIVYYKNFYKIKKEQLINKLKNNNMCPVCYVVLDKMDKIYISECCTQKICNECIEQWVNKLKKTNCIYCNTEDKPLSSYALIDKTLNEENNNNIDEDEDKHKEEQLIGYNNYSKYEYSKMHFLEEYIKQLKNTNKKILLFSDFSNVFNNIQIICKNNHIEYEDLEKGNMIDIEKAVMNYKYGNAKILLANSSLFSCGMNLENSTHIIFVHKIDEKILEQVLGRAQRMGRTCALSVIHLEYANEIEIEKEQVKEFIHIDSNSTSIEALNQQNDIFNNIEDLDSQVKLPDYNEIIDVNLDELILSLN